MRVPMRIRMMGIVWARYKRIRRERAQRTHSRNDIGSEHYGISQEAHGGDVHDVSGVFLSEVCSFRSSPVGKYNLEWARGDVVRAR